jgi:plastocyanin
VALAACGAVDPQQGRTATVVGEGKGGEVRVVGTEYAFDPAHVVARRAGALEITLANEGTLAHNLRVVGPDGGDLGGTPTFPGGDSRSGTVQLGPGRYRMVCTVGDHEQLGMVGTLTVE